MKRRQLVMLSVMLLGAALVLILVLRNRQPPRIPPDEDHRVLYADECMECHGPDGGLPQDPNHPIGRECSRCHGR